MHEQREARVIARRHPEPPAPVRAARHRGQPAAVELDPRVAVRMPLPLRRGADRIHHRLPQHVGQRAPEPLQQREAQAVDADVVVLPQRAGRLQGAWLALLGAAEVALAEVAVVVDGVRLVPHRALPLAGLLQQMPPRDASILVGCEIVVDRRRRYRLVEVTDQAARHGDAGQHGEVALGDAERHVGAPRVAPLGDEVARAQDEPVEVLARAHRPQHLRLGRLVGHADEPPRLGDEVAGPGALMAAVPLHRRLEPVLAEAELGRRLRCPLPRGRHVAHER